MHAPRSWYLALVLPALAVACGGGATPAESAAQARGGIRPEVAHRRLDDRPPLVLVRREGDPAAAVAFASAHDFGALGSATVAAVLKARLTALGFRVRARPSALGFTLTALVPNGAEARRFVTAVARALVEPLAPADPALLATRAAVQTLTVRHLAGPAEEATASCAGELYLRQATRWDPSAERPRAELGAWLRSAHGIKSSAFAAVGPSGVLRAVEDALAEGPAWPEGTAAADPWPARDTLGVDFAPSSSHRLSFALRLASEDRAAGAVEALVDPRGTLARRLAALRPEWHVDRAAAIGRPRGACLRVDASPVHAEVGPAAADVARALTVLTEEVQQATESASEGSVDAAITGTTDPGEAAAAAAWRALVGRDDPGAPRTNVAYVAGTSDKGRFDLAQALSALREASAQPLLEVARRAEPGQGRLWALLAPTCGTTPESAGDAGEAALVVSALARAAAPSDITVEPWIATDGVGLLVGTRRKGPDETAAAQARRLGRALGELVATTRPSPAELVAARDDLAQSVGGETHRGYFVALDALTQGHPSWLEPRGTFEALGSAPAGGFEPALSRWLARPLRLGVLVNGDSDQAELMRAEIERWLRPVRGNVLRCPTRSRAAVTGGELTVTVAGDTPEGSYVGVPFPAFEHRLPLEARATVLLLNRTGGLLDQALVGLPASATALGLGGPDQAALVVEVATAEGQRQAAVERLRALFDQLAGGRVNPNELDLARRELAEQDAAEALDPRRRLVAAWRGAGKPEAGLDAARLAKFLASLRRSATVVVNVVPRE